MGELLGEEVSNPTRLGEITWIIIAKFVDAIPVIAMALKSQNRRESPIPIL